MAQNISLLGATYPAVPAVILPKSGGGSATFIEETELANAGTNTPLADSATGAVGSSTSYSREDHVHPISPAVLKDTNTSVTTAPSSDTAILNYDMGCYRIALSATTSYLPNRYGVLEIIHAASYGVARFTTVNSSSPKVYFRTFNVTNKTWYDSQWIG